MLDFEQRVTTRRITIEEFLASPRPAVPREYWDDAFPEIVIIHDINMERSGADGSFGFVREKIVGNRKAGVIFIPMHKPAWPVMKLDLTVGIYKAWLNSFKMIDDLRKAVQDSLAAEGLLDKPLYMTKHRRPGLYYAYWKEEANILQIQLDVRLGVEGWSGRINFPGISP